MTKASRTSSQSAPETTVSPVVTNAQRAAFAVLDQWLNPPQAAALVSQGSRSNWAELDRQIEILRPLFAP